MAAVLARSDGSCRLRSSACIVVVAAGLNKDQETRKRCLSACLLYLQQLSVRCRDPNHRLPRPGRRIITLLRKASDTKVIVVGLENFMERLKTVQAAWRRCAVCRLDTCWALCDALKRGHWG